MSSEMLRPFISSSVKEFWDGVERHELLAQECTACGEKFFPPRACCPKCFGTDFSWFKLSGRGTLYSWTKIFFPVVTPYYLGVIDLEENIGRIIALLDIGIGEPEIGDQMEIEFVEFRGTPMFQFIIKNH